MELISEAAVLVVRLALAGFVIWGGWLCVSPGPRAEDYGFERVASLVLLALLFTTIAGVAQG
ncbi:MAG TPA: hypothetical protein VFK84_09120 [Burkholderiales bacterium]|nr:hypothetical protein [Burkholderiales bacterium]